MRNPSKPVWLLIGVHTLCLSVGYWFLCQLLISSTEHQAVESGWTDLFSRSGPLAEAAAATKAVDLTSESPALERLRSLVHTLSGVDETSVLLVSDGWNVLTPLSNSVKNGWKSGDRVTWQSD